ncbi:helix-turn-helix domain-containing protein [Vibrio navarrensis]|nr:helix-turn-helix domain-containing protein [Vibrio navarrensis]
MNNSVLSQKFVKERRDWTKGERIIAEDLALEPEEVWSGRYKLVSTVS